jgi:Cu(I)/Ag(I) efflux system membrane fusion protein
MNMMKYLNIGVVVLGFAAVPPSLWAQGCCNGDSSMEGCTMGKSADAHKGHTAHVSPTDSVASTRAVFMQPVQSVFDNYISIQGELAQDSIAGLSKTGTAMAKAIRDDSMQMLSPKVAEQAEALAQAKDLEAARAAYKSLSELLIKYAKSQKLPAGSYYEAYCPMAKASWLQTDKTILNPYMGKGMIHCGVIKG